VVASPAMSFLDRFTAEQRRLFEGAASTLEIPKGQYLLRRGEPGGDVYLVQKGACEVVDSRSTPEVILRTLEEGTFVGEMAFIDDSPRSADVRAAQDSVVLHWARDDLRSLLARQPALASAFYESVARQAADRVRYLTTTAIAGASTRTEGRTNAPGLSRVREDARRIAESTKEQFLECDQRLRQDATDKVAQQKLRDVLDKLQEEVQLLFTTNPEPESCKAAARILTRELHPYLVRSSLAERCIRKKEGIGGAADVLAHVLVDSAAGDGQFGEIMDRWLLDRPMLKAMRSFREPVLDVVSGNLPRHRNRRVLVVNAGTGSLVASLAHVVGQAPTVLTVMDQSKDALAYLDAGLTMRPKSVELKTVQENLAAFAMGRQRVQLPPQDAIVLHGLLEYMPERIAISLLNVCRTFLAPGGTLAVCALGPSDDHELFDWLLGWSTIRRSTEAMRRIYAAAGLDAAEQREMHPPAMLFVGRARLLQTA
jgi:CRP-like cAMP-binding protein/SAM-dependent methyltransferase